LGGCDGGSGSLLPEIWHWAICISGFALAVRAASAFHPDPVQLTQLIGYESQQDALLKNTEFLLAGYPALHVAYGSRGSGKSLL